MHADMRTHEYNICNIYIYIYIYMHVYIHDAMMHRTYRLQGKQVVGCNRDDLEASLQDVFVRHIFASFFPQCLRTLGGLPLESVGHSRQLHQRLAVLPGNRNSHCEFLN